MTTIHNVMVAHGDGAKRVWATEVVFTTVTGVSSGVTEANTTTMLVNLVTRLKALAAAESPNRSCVTTRCGIGPSPASASPTSGSSRGPLAQARLRDVSDVGGRRMTLPQ